MAKKGIRYAVFAALSNQVLYPPSTIIDDQYAHTGNPADPYTATNYKKWMVRDVHFGDGYGYAYYQYTPLYQFSPVVAFNGSLASGISKDYGDDVVSDVDVGEITGTLSIELNNDRNKIYQLLFNGSYGYAYGHQEKPYNIEATVVTDSNDDSGVIYNVNNFVPYVGVGAIGRSGDKWVAKWYPLVKFRQPNDDNQTRQENVTFGHVTFEADIFVDKFGIWKQQKAFDSLSSAKLWLRNRLNPANWEVS